MAETAFAGTSKWCSKDGYKLSVYNQNIRKFYERYKTEYNIGHDKAPSPDERKEFEEIVIKLIRRAFNEKYRRDFVYPGTDWDRQLFTELVNTLDVDSIKKKGSELN